MEGSKEYFDMESDRWNQLQDEFFSTSVRVKAYELVKPEAGKIAVDMGAGTGFVTEGLLPYGVKVIAIDQSQEMLDHLKEKLTGQGEITCIQADGMSLPLENNSVDYAFANMYLHHVESPEGAIRELYRILKKGGKLVITDLDSHGFEFLIEEQHDKWLGFQRDDINSWFKLAGFSDISVNDTGMGCSSKSECSCVSARISIFAAYGEKI